MTDKPRSTEQNARMWAMLTDVSRQVVWYGQKLQPEEWKDVFSASLNRQKVVPGIDGGFVVLGALSLCALSNADSITEPALPGCDSIHKRIHRGRRTASSSRRRSSDTSGRPRWAGFLSGVISSLHLPVKRGDRDVERQRVSRFGVHAAHFDDDVLARRGVVRGVFGVRVPDVEVVSIRLPGSHLDPRSHSSAPGLIQHLIRHVFSVFVGHDFEGFGFGDGLDVGHVALLVCGQHRAVHMY